MGVDLGAAVDIGCQWADEDPLTLPVAALRLVDDGAGVRPLAISPPEKSLVKSLIQVVWRNQHTFESHKFSGEFVDRGVETALPPIPSFAIVPDKGFYRLG